jgi:hypothetical protein
MANEIKGVSSTGTLYSRLLNTAGQSWNTASAAFETYAAANYADYDLPMTEQGNSGVYCADFPATIITAGTYEYFVHRQAGASPAEGDSIINTGKVDWTGTNAVTVTAATGAMTGSEWRDYVLRCGFRRTDKDSELYEATTDTIQEMRRRFMFDEAEVDSTTTDTISVSGDFKIDLESDMGLLLGVTLQDGVNASRLTQKSKSEFDELYPDINVTADRGYPTHFCVYAGSIYIGPIPDSVTYTYRLNYSRRAGTITSSTAGVPFTNLYREILADGVLSRLYKGLEEYDKANYHRGAYEEGMVYAIRRERNNAGVSTFVMKPLDV